MQHAASLFFGAFATLLAIINPLEAMPVFLLFSAGKDDKACRDLARRSCIYATLLMLFFLVFGTLVLRIFGIPLDMVRVVGGIILTKIGFELFSPSPSGGSIIGNAGTKEDVAFIPMAMPIMFGPGAIATVLSMTSLVKWSASGILYYALIVLAILLTMFTTWLFLRRAQKIMQRLGPKGVDAASRIVGFFVSCMGMGLVFHGTIEMLQTYGIAKSS